LTRDRLLGTRESMFVIDPPRPTVLPWGALVFRSRWTDHAESPNQPGDPTSHLPVEGQPELEVVNRQLISLSLYSALVSWTSRATRWADGVAGGIWPDGSDLGRTANMSYKQWHDWVSRVIDFIKVCPNLPTAPDWHGGGRLAVRTGLSPKQQL